MKSLKNEIENEFGEFTKRDAQILKIVDSYIEKTYVNCIKKCSIFPEKAILKTFKDNLRGCHEN